MTLLVACGKVITPEPTQESTPAEAAASASTPTPRPTATAPFQPPADTATPTVTPTPIIYVVQAGDTLQGIAFDHGVSVEALQRVNGVENPLSLQIGQSLIIPVAKEEGASGTTPGLLLPTPTPQPFEVQGVALYETPAGGLWCLGEVVNSTAVYLTNVQVRVTLFNGAGETLAQADTFAAADLIPPGTQSPFGILFTMPPTGWVNYQVTVVRGEDAGALTDAYVPITVTEVDGRPSGSQFQVSGVIHNTSTGQAAGKVHVIATTYNAQGMVTGFRQHTIADDEPLAPGATAPFDVSFTSHGDAPQDFNIIALGRTAAE